MNKSAEKSNAIRKEKVFRLLRGLEAGKVTLPQYRAQMKDMDFDEWEIDLYVDGDANPEDYQ